MNIVFVWIWGSGISALAYITKEIWYNNIVWIDKSESEITENLQKNGIKVFIWHGAYQIQKDDFVIYSDATLNTDDVKEAKKNNIKTLSYFEFLGMISRNFKTISVAWTHGKSSTTSMLIEIFAKIHKNFAIWIVWALMPKFENKNYYLNKNLNDKVKKIFGNIFEWKENKNTRKYYFVLEADEFNKHFLHLQSYYSIITNIELDHSDVYIDFYTYLQAFKDFIKLTDKKVFMLNNDKNIRLLKSGKIEAIEEKAIDFKYIFGNHNDKNGSLAYGISKHINKTTKSSTILKILRNFKWIWRRMEFLGKNKNGTMIYTDYWHHPWELCAVYEAFRQKFPNKKLIWVFQPHQARRVLEFWDEFKKILKKFDEIYIYDIYAARESLDQLKIQFQNKEFNNINSIAELWELFAKQVWWKYIENFEEVCDIFEKAKWWDIIVNFSAGDLDFQIRNCEIFKK